VAGAVVDATRAARAAKTVTPVGAGVAVASPTR
jgi:hypothetical protein